MGAGGAHGQTESGASPQQPPDLIPIPLMGSIRQSHHLDSTLDTPFELGNPSLCHSMCHDPLQTLRMSTSPFPNYLEHSKNPSAVKP